MKLLVDMNLSPRWEGVLRAAGFAASHWSDIGPYDASDPAIMRFAVENGYVVLTHDLDFGAILAASRSGGPSVVQVRTGDASPEAIGSVVVAALRQMEDELNRGALVTVDTRRTRLRLLPLR